MFLKALGKDLSEITFEEIPRILCQEAIASLTQAEIDTVFAQTRLVMEQTRLKTLETDEEGKRLQAHIDALKSTTAELDRELDRNADWKLRKLQLEVIDAQTKMVAKMEDSLKATAPAKSEQASLAWDDEILLAAFFKDNPNFGETTVVSYKQAFREFAGIAPKSLGDVTKSDIGLYADDLRDRDSNRGKTLKHGSIAKLLGHVRMYFTWAFSKGYIGTNPGVGVKARKKTREEKLPENQRRSFTKAELTVLFESPIFTGCKSIGRRMKKGDNVYRDDKYWFFLIAYLSGARLDEIAEAPASLEDLDGVLCLDFRHATKTPNAPRLIPVLPELKRLGIEQWVASQKRRGRKLVEGATPIQDWSKWTNRYLDVIGLDAPTLCEHSLRHNFRDQLRAADLKDEIMNKVFGHDGDTTGQKYGPLIAPDEARLVIEKFKPVIGLEHLWQSLGQLNR